MKRKVWIPLLCVALVITIVAGVNVFLNSPYHQSDKLIAAIQDHDKDAVVELLESGVDPNVNNRPDRPIFNSLLEQSPKRPLSIACQEGDLEMVKLLISYGAVVNYPDDGTRPPLVCAVLGYDKDDVAMVKLLLENGADVSQIYASSLPIHYVAQMSPNARNENGEFVYNEDVAQDIVEIAKLVNGDSDINGYSKKFTPLMYTASRGNKALVEYFLSIGADKTAKLSDGRTAYDLAMLHGHTEVAELLK